MLTLFAIPKPFTGHIGIIQRNAIKSWTLLRPQCEIMLFGDEEGTEDVAREFGLRHVSQIARNELGTPLLNDMFDTAQHLASHRLLCFVNADIMLMSAFLQAVEQVCRWRESFLMIGRRSDVRIRQAWNFARHDWEQELQRYVKEYGKLRGDHNVDYFVFPKGFYDHVPPFAIGRPFYDSWLISKAISSRHPIVDATDVVMAAHQNHDHAHFGIQGEVYSLREAHGLAEGKGNYELLGGELRRFGASDTSHILTESGECRQKHRLWRFVIVKKRLKLKLRHEFMERTRLVRHRLGLTEPNLHRLKKTFAFALSKANLRAK
ncbi:MAG: hypothetical protein ACREX3_23605 [Gammaproteobacteria bacterium]